jgi:hypothetical protein
MKKSEGSVMLVSAAKRVYDLRAARGTHIKFTRSFHANAIARENVHTSTISLNTFTFSVKSKLKIRNHIAKAIAKNRIRLFFTQSIAPAYHVITDPFIPFTRIK